MKRFLLAAAAVVIVAGPALAQPQPDQKPEHRSAATARPERPNAAAPQRGPAPRTPNVHTYGGPMPSGERFAPQRSAPGYATPGRPYAPQYNGRQQSGADHHMVNGQDRFLTPGQRGLTPGQRALTPGQRELTPGQRGLTPGQRGLTPGQRGDFRTPGQRGYWGGQAQRNQGWWRGERGFERYEGRRDGFWFAPGYGYYRPDPRWYGFDWEIGVSVPYELRSYYISDPYAYDLPPAPYGCAWIFLGNELVMIDVQTGQIVQIAGQY